MARVELAVGYTPTQTPPPPLVVDYEAVSPPLYHTFTFPQPLIGGKVHYAIVKCTNGAAVKQPSPLHTSRARVGYNHLLSHGQTEHTCLIRHPL